MRGSSGSAHAPSVYTSRRSPPGSAGSSAGRGRSGPTPWATCANARSAGPAGRSPVRAWPA
eukprot:9836808-Lingulodinium_polyedra.AAC.1